MQGYTAIIIIYNPKSTGSGKKLALKLQKELLERLPKQVITIIPTDRAGHAEELAYEHARKLAHPLVISSSGDGGYHEVINGLLRAQKEGAKPVAGLLPAGNANDHFHHLHEAELVEEIVAQNEKTIDVLKLSYLRHGQSHERYAHSYIGLGVTPQAGRELNRHNLNRFMESWLVLKSMLLLTPVKIFYQGKVQAYDSIVFSNISKMSKIINISDKARVNDGRFEVTMFKRRNKIRLFMTLLKASTRGLKGSHQRRKFTFKTIGPALVQLDGEITTIDGNATTTVTIEPRAINCLV
jgi:diacylglycerol kinase (ATP)